MADGPHRKRRLPNDDDEASGSEIQAKQPFPRYPQSVIRDARIIEETLGMLGNFDSLCRIMEKIEENEMRVERLLNEILETSWKNVERKYLAEQVNGISLIVNQANPLVDVDEVDLFRDVEKVLTMLNKTNPAFATNPNEIYRLLEVHVHDPMRTHTVLRELQGNDAVNENDNHGSSLVDDVAQVLARLPQADPNRVYALLEETQFMVDRIEQTVARLSGQPRLLAAVPVAPVATAATAPSEVAVHDDDVDGTQTRGDADQPSTSRTVNGPRTGVVPASHTPEPEWSDELMAVLLPDIDTVSRAVPDVDRGIIMKLLGPLQDNPARAELVIERLLMGDGLANGDVLDINGGAPVFGIPRNLRIGLDEESLHRLEQDASALKSAFPLCDPIYIYERLSGMKADDPQQMQQGALGRVQLLGMELMELRNYPLLQDRISQHKKMARAKYLMNMAFDLPQFLEKFVDPVQEFCDETKKVSPSYQQHVIAYLTNTFVHLKVDYIRTTLAAHNYRLSTTAAIFDADMEGFRNCKLHFHWVLALTIIFVIWLTDLLTYSFASCVFRRT